MKNVTVENGVATFTENQTIGARTEIPNNWDEVVIEDGVTLRGSFLVPTNRNKPLTIRGESRKGSKIIGLGNDRTYQGDFSLGYSTIAHEGDAEITIENLTSDEPDFYHLYSNGKLDVDRVNLTSSEDDFEKDGFAGGDGSSIKNSFISTNDDAIKINDNNIVVENVRIEHLRNGAPFQMGWGSFQNGSATIKDVTVVNASDDIYNMGIISWADKDRGGFSERTLEIDGLTRTSKPGAAEAPMYQFGTRFGSGSVRNAKINIEGFNRDSNDIDRYNGSSGQVSVSGNPNPTPEPEATPLTLEPEPTPTPDSQTIRINAGGGAYIDRNGNQWGADRFSTGGRTYATTAGIDNTGDDSLFQTERYGKNFSYDIPVENGTYQVGLSFAEIFWQESNKRVFNVSIEDRLAIDDLDIYKSAGADKNEALERQFTVGVDDGTLNLDFNSSIDNAKIGALEIEKIS